MASPFWLSLCLILFAYNLVDLLNDRHQLSYKIVEQGDVLFDADYDLNYLICTPFWEIQRLNSFPYEPETQNVSVRSFLNHSIASIEHKLKVTGLFQLNESFIFNDHVCFPTNKSELAFNKKKPFNEFLHKYRVQNIFIYSKEKQPNFYEMAYYKNDGLRSIHIRSYKQKVFGVNHLLNAHCLNRTHQIHHDRFTCLNRCFKELKMKWAFYRFDDQGTFDLRQIQLKEKQIVKREVNDEEEALEVIRQLTTPSNTEGVEECLRRCPESACFWEVVISLKNDEIFRLNSKEGKDNINLQLNTYAAFYSMDDFYLQLFGLLSLFTGTSVLGLLHILLLLASQKIKPLLKSKKLFRTFRQTLRNLKKALTLLCFVLVLVQSLTMVNEFRFHSSHPNRTSSLNFSSEPFSVVICFPCYMEDPTAFRNFSFNSIEKATKNLSETEIKSMEIYSGKKRFEPKFRRSSEILFKSSKFNDTSFLSRCFRLDLDLDERFRKMPLAYLQIDFNTKHREIFLIEKGQNFTSGLVNLRGLFYPQKVTKIHSKSSVKSNCKDYSQEPNCGSRRNCLDQCLSMEFIEKHGSIPTNTIVNSKYLNSTWLNGSIYFNETIELAIIEKCSARFNQTDCNEVRFEESSELVFQESRPMVFFKMNYLNIVEREMEYDWVKTLLDIVSLQTILFGSNALGMLTNILLFLCRILRLKWRRVYRVFLFLLASAGFLAHNVLVFRTIISGDLHENEFFEKPEQYSLPSAILCFRIKKEVDENYRITGKYMDNLTAEITFKQAFWKIRYNNRTHEKDLHIWKLNSMESPNFYSSSELELSHFYYLGTKCLKTSLKVSFKEEDFLLLTDKTVLELYLNWSFATETKYTAFVHQQADSREIGGGFVYDIGKWIGNPNLHYSYSIEFELFRIVREDQFEQLKDPRRLFQERVKVNDAKTDETIRRQFEEIHNRTTDHLPLDEHFDAEIDNKLYQQYAKKTIDLSSFQSLDFEQNIANTYTKVYYTPFELNNPHFSFSFSFLERRVVITNSENYTKLVVSLLNTLSLWLDICVIDMGAWLISFIRFALHLHRRLIKTRDAGLYTEPSVFWFRYDIPIIPNQNRNRTETDFRQMSSYRNQTEPMPSFQSILHP